MSQKKKTQDDFDNPGSVIGEYKAELLLFLAVAIGLIAAFLLRIYHIITPTVSNVIMIAITLLLVLLHMVARKKK